MAWSRVALFVSVAVALAVGKAAAGPPGTNKHDVAATRKQCAGPLFQLGDKLIAGMDDLAKYFSHYSLIPKIDTSEIVALDVVGAPCGAFASNGTLYVRAGTLDLRHLKAVFQQQQLKPLQQVFARAPPKRILHLGAHTGMATMWFVFNFPGAQIVALEPELQSFAMMRLNTAPYGWVHAEYGAAWDKTSTVKLERRDRGRSLFQRFVVDVMEMSTGKLGDIVPATNVSDLLKKYGWTGPGQGLVDLVHADMEGAERVVIADASARDWLRHVKCLSMRTSTADVTAAVIRTLSAMEPKFVRRSPMQKSQVSVWCRADAADVDTAPGR